MQPAIEANKQLVASLKEMAPLMHLEKQIANKLMLH
jgi:hypothetical protein